jgi:hypothetical protein
MKSILWLMFLAGCSQCTPTIPGPPAPPPDEPTQAEKCAAACERWRANDCKDAEDVCTEFDDDSGECIKTITCEESCVANPDAYDTDAECS